MREGVEGDHTRAYFNSDIGITSHKIHAEGELFHTTHSGAWGKIQVHIKNYHKMLDLYQQQTRLYMQNSNLPTNMDEQGLHQFVQLIPKNSYQPTKTSDNIPDGFDTNFKLNKYNFHHGLTSLASGTSGASGAGQCDYTYHSTQGAGGGNYCTDTFKTLGTTPKKELSNLFEYYGKSKIYNKGTQILHDDSCIGGDGCNTTDIKNGQNNPTKIATPNDLYYKAYSNIVNPDDTHPLIAADNPFTTYSDKLKDLKFQSYTLPTPESVNPSYVPYTLMNTEDGGRAVTKLKNLLPSGSATVKETLDKNKLVVTIDNVPNENLFRLVKGVVLKRDIVFPSSATPVDNPNITPDTEYVQVYTTGTGTDKNNSLYAPVSNVPDLSGFVNNDFASGSIRLYAAVKTITASDGSTTDCGSISNPDDRNIIPITTSVDDSIIVEESAANILRNNQPVRRGASSKKWCDVINAPKKDGEKLLHMHKIIQAVGVHIQRELFLFDLYQRGTVVKGTVTVNGSKNTVLDTSIQRDETVNLEDLDNPPDVNESQYIVIPKLMTLPQQASAIQITTSIEPSACKLCASNYVIVPWTSGNLETLKAYSSGARFKGMSNSAYKKASDALMESYKTVEHDVKELNKIKALQTDVSILGNMHYYRMIIYAVVLFFLLVSMYYIHAAD